MEPLNFFPKGFSEAKSYIWKKNQMDVPKNNNWSFKFFFEGDFCGLKKWKIFKIFLTLQEWLELLQEEGKEDI